MIDIKTAQKNVIPILESGSKLQNEKQALIDQLKALIPQVVNSDNQVNVKALQAVLDVASSHHKNEGYELTFAGKALARHLADTPTDWELKVEREQSKDFDHTANVVIRGDNLEVLKILYQNYHRKIKMIYIDPPYNTQSENFVYKDNFKMSNDELEQFGLDKESKNFLQNVYGTRSHSGWLAFMYPRLKLARELLRDDGVIFISIDDNEQANLKIVCDEIFGEGNLDIMIWRKAGLGRDGKMKNTSTFRKDHEYITVCFNNLLKLNKSLEKPDWINKYENPDNDSRGAYKPGSISRKEDASNIKHKNYYTVISPSGKSFTRQFDVSESEFEKLNKDNRIYWGKNDDAVPAIKIFENEKRKSNTSSIFLENNRNLAHRYMRIIN